jgi:hypothetical protein
MAKVKRRLAASRIHPSHRRLQPSARRACYTSRIVFKGCFWTLLLAFSLWIPSHTFLKSQAGMGPCQSACTCGCCMHGHGKCPMMMRMGGAGGSHALNASGSGPSPSGFRCTCSVSQDGSSFLPVSHSDLFFELPRREPAQELPSLRYRGYKDVARAPVADASIPDPPPKSLAA